MQDFTLAQILTNLLLAVRWTIVLSAIAFVGGGLVGFLLMLMRISSNPLLKS
ncbi:MAG: amino acid ABC transporter permease, partial [Cyanobacteria bacterium P01_A01_bin.114]